MEQEQKQAGDGVGRMGWSGMGWSEMGHHPTLVKVLMGWGMEEEDY